jgi:hypothetical protein
LVQADFSRYKAGQPCLEGTLGAGRVWPQAAATVLEGPLGRAAAVNQSSEGAANLSADINVTRGAGRAGLKVSHLRMPAKALSVVLWFSSDSGTGKLFGKEGINAFGKSYRTISCSLDNGRLNVPGLRLGGGQVKAGTWHQVALCVDEKASALYLDGALVAEGLGTPDIVTDALDFLSDHAGAVAGIALYNRRLVAEDVQQLHAHPPGR